MTKTVAKTVTSQTAQSLFDQGGRYSSVFIRLAGFSGATAVILGYLELYLLLYCPNLNWFNLLLNNIGAYGAHRVWNKDPAKPNKDPKAIFETANR